MLLVLSVLALIVTSFLCSLSEASLLSIGRARVETLAEQSKVGRIIRDMKRDLGRPVATILVLNTVANTGGAALAGSEYRKLFGDNSMVFFGAALTVGVLLFSEFIPKSLGVRYADRAAQFVARPLAFTMRVLRPITWVLEQAARLFGAGGPGTSSVSVDDLRAMARLAASAKVLGREEVMIIEAASRLPRVAVREIMIHGPDIVYFVLADDAESNLVRARRSLHSRLLLARTDLTDVVGVVNMKEVLWRLAEEPEDLEEEGLNRILGEAMREPLYAAPDIDVSDLIELFATNHEHLAVVRNDEGTVVGIVTLEDVIEELMGEIDDESDRTPAQIEQRAVDWFRIGGGASWGDVQTRLQLPAEGKPDAELDGRIDVNDLAADQLRGRLRTGASFKLGAWHFRVVRMRRGKVVAVDAFGQDRAKFGRASSHGPGTIS